MQFIETIAAPAMTDIVQLAPVRNVERRQGDRFHTVCRVARVISADDQGLARVRNISDLGLSLELYFPVCLGDRLTVHLTDDLSVNGDVVWSTDSWCGLRLDEPIDSVSVLRDLGARVGRADSRAIRLPVAKVAVAHTENGLRSLEIQDVSQRGMKVRHDGSFRKGLPIKVTLASGIERRGIVRWSHDRTAGILLTQPFSPSELGSARYL